MRRRRGWNAEDVRHAVDLHLSGLFNLWGQEHLITVGYNYEELKEEAIYGLNELIPDVPIRNPDQVPRLDLPPLVRGGEYETRQSGYYGQVRVTIADPVILVMGARTSDYRYRSRNMAPSAATGWARGAHETGEVTPYGGIVYRLGASATLYGSYADIFIPQTQRRFDGLRWTRDRVSRSSLVSSRVSTTTVSCSPQRCSVPAT